MHKGTSIALAVLLEAVTGKDSAECSPDTEIAVESPDWKNECTGGQPDSQFFCIENQCQCLEFFGREGPDCLERNAVSTLLMVLSALNGCFLLGLLCRWCIHFQLLRSVNKKSCKADVQLTFGCFQLASFIGGLIWCVAYFLGGSGVGDLRTVNTTVKRVGITITGTFSVCAWLNISLMWIEMAKASKQLKQGGQNLDRFKNMVIGLSVLFAVVNVALMNINTNYAGYWSIIYVFGICITYKIGSRKLSQVLLNSKVPGSKEKVAAITGTSNKLCIFLVLYVIGGIAFGVGRSAWIKVVAANSMVVFCLLAHLVAQAYTLRLTRSRVGKSSTHRLTQHTDGQRASNPASNEQIIPSNYT